MGGTEVEWCCTAVLDKKIKKLIGSKVYLQLGDEDGNMLGNIDGFELSLLVGDEECSGIGSLLGAQD